MNKLLILEVNEVPFKIYDHYLQTNPDSALAKLIGSSKQYITQSTDTGELHPWSTWPTFYRGVDNTKHLIKDIGEDLSSRNKEYPPVWDILVSNNVNVGVFASLHTYPLAEDYTKYSFLVPDPFANGMEAHPRSLISFQDFNLSMTRKSGRSVDRGIDKKKAIKMALSFPKIGIRTKTVFKVLNQLVLEKKSPWKASRRRTYQSVLAFDLFLNQLKKHKPDFTTFFSNHVASAMHRYWAATFPEDYENNELPKEWIERYKNEIPFCMNQLNSMIEDLEKFLRKNPEYKLVIASSMGQEATKAKLINQELFLTNHNHFKKFLNISGLEFVSAMHPQYNFQVDEGSVNHVLDILNKITLNGEPLKYRVKDKKFFSIDLGYPDISHFEVKLGEQEVSIEDLGFEIKKIDDQSAGTAYHIPEGTFLIYDAKNPQKSSERKQIDLREVAPAILNYFKVESRAYMKKPSFDL